MRIWVAFYKVSQEYKIQKQNNSGFFQSTNPIWM